MLLSITTTHRPATDLGYLLAKHPHRLQLLHPPGYDFYAACRTKLGWSSHLTDPRRGGNE